MSQIEPILTWWPTGGYWPWGYPYYPGREDAERKAVIDQLGITTCVGSGEYNFALCRCEIPTWTLNLTVKQTDDVSLPPLHVIADPAYSGGLRVPAVIAPFEDTIETRWNEFREFNIALLSGYAVELPGFDDAFDGGFGPPPDPPPDPNAVTIIQLTFDPVLADAMPTGPYRFFVRAKVTDTDLDPDTGDPIEDIPPTAMTLLYGTFVLKDC